MGVQSLESQNAGTLTGECNSPTRFFPAPERRDPVPDLRIRRSDLKKT